MTDQLALIMSRFPSAGAFRSAQPITDGHINDTFVLESTVGRFVLQRINHHVFRDPAGLMRNIALVTDHIRKKLIAEGGDSIKRRVLTPIPTQEGDCLAAASDDDYWRLYHYIEGSHTPGASPTLQEIHQAGVGFGRFVSLLADMPLDFLCETIPNFHHGPLRYQALVDAVEEDAFNRRAVAAKEIDLVLGHEELLARPQRLLEQGVLPLRVTHNDTKSNNVLLDDATNEALAVIDLDTVMPGLVLYDFGDLVRTTATCAAEDETDLSLVEVVPDRLEAATTGFLAGLDGRLEPAERESLTIGPSYMALIMATRFLTDYLQGDTYYKTSRPGHNLDRCRNQIALVESLERFTGYLRGESVDA